MKTFKFEAVTMALAALVLCGTTAQAQGPGGSAPAPAVAVPQVSPPAAEVVKLASSGVGDDVVMAYIRNSQAVFDLNADQLLYLKDVGLSPQVITAMLDHDNGIKGQTQPNTPPPQEQQPAPPPPQQQQQYAPQATQPPPGTQYAQPTSAPGPGAVPAASGPPPAYVGSAPMEVGYFYNDLSPYGSWVDLAGVGWCWQPSAVAVTPGWRPYCNGGRWMWTDAGWFWQSDYSWGWAPFHYGRWYQDGRCGWVWMPGTTWGPAWVTWRTAGTTCGWAPLPPHADFVAGVGWRYNGVTVGATFDFGLGVNAFAFVSFGNMCSPNVYNYCLPRSQTTVIYKQTTIVNNYVVNNNTFINRGIAYDRIAAASHTPIPQATVRQGSVGKPIVGSGNGSFVYREPLHMPAKQVNMVAQKVDMGHTIQHTSINTLKYEPKTTPGGNGSSTASFQHNNNFNNQNSIGKGQPNANFNTRPVGQTENFGKNQPINSGKNQTATVKPTYQWQNTEKNVSNPQTTTGNKTFQPNQSYQPTGSKQTPYSTTSTGNGSALSSQTPAGKQEDLRGKQEYSTAGHNTAAMGSGQQNTFQQQQNYHWYQPKSSEQASEIRSLPKTEPTRTTTPTMPTGSGYNSQGYKSPTYNNSGSQQFKKNQ